MIDMAIGAMTMTMTVYLTIGTMVIAGVLMTTGMTAIASAIITDAGHEALPQIGMTNVFITLQQMKLKSLAGMTPILRDIDEI